MIHPLYGLIAPFSKGVIILSMGYISVRIHSPLADGFHRIPMAYAPLRWMTPLFRWIIRPRSMDYVIGQWITRFANGLLPVPRV